MAKICFPHYEKGEFASLADALKFLERETYLQYALCQIVKYNTCYRNHLRRHGVGGGDCTTNRGGSTAQG